MSSIFENSSVYKIGDSFTMKNILNIVDKMNDAMPHHEFEPEPISEGGIRVKLDGDGYKTIRFHTLTTGLGVRVVSKRRISIEN